MMAVNNFSGQKKPSNKIYEILKWDQTSVSKYLEENNIEGCGPALAANDIDGVAFLSLNNQSLSTWKIPIIKRSKIIALLSELGPENWRTEIVIKAQISSRLNHATSNLQISKLAASSIESSSSHLNFPSLQKPQNHLKGSNPLEKPSPDAESSDKPPLPVKPKHFPPKPEQLRWQRSENQGAIPNIQNTVVNKEIVDDSNYEIPINNGDLRANDDITSIQFPPIDDDGEDDFDSEEDESEIDYSDGDYIIPDSQKPRKDSEKRKRKAGIFSSILSSSKWSMADDKQPSGDSFCTPPIPPARSRNTSRSSSESNLNQSGSETPPQILPARKQTSQSSLSSLAESPLQSPSYPPPPVPTTARRITPMRRTSPGQLDPNSFGSQTLPLSPNRSRAPSPLPRGASPSPKSRANSDDYDSLIYPWYLNVNRQQAEALLKNSGNGTFLIRPSEHGGKSAPNTLCLHYNQRVFNVLIRIRPDRKLALGFEKAEERTFNTLNELVEFHRHESMQLHVGNTLAGTTCLTYWPEMYCDVR